MIILLAVEVINVFKFLAHFLENYEEIIVGNVKNQRTEKYSFEPSVTN